MWHQRQLPRRNLPRKVGGLQIPANVRVEVVVSEALANVRVEVVVSEAPVNVRAAEASEAGLVATINPMTDLQRKYSASIVQPRWSRAAAVLASVLWWS